MIRFNQYRVVAFICLSVFGFMALAGCAAPVDPWSQYYQAPAAVAGVYPSGLQVQPIEVRMVKVAQIEAADAAVVKYFWDNRLTSKTATPADRLSGRQVLLTELHMVDDPALIATLGVSNFVGPVPVSPNDPAMLEFARRLGADTVILACDYSGERQSTRLMPVTSTTTSTANATARGPSGTANATATGTSYTRSMVPVTATYQSWDTIALYWRHVTAAERKAIDFR